MPTLILRSLFTRLSLTSSFSLSISRTTVSALSPATSSFSLGTSNPSSANFSPTQWRQSRPFHATAAQPKSMVPSRGSSKRGRGKKRKGRTEGPDPRIVNLKASMPRKVPAPLRFARNRALRHWTIHRAWLLYQRKERVSGTMSSNVDAHACEELRNTSGPGSREEGYLFRVAMEKHGMYGHNAIPIEYARPQSETPARQAWNHEWTR